MLERAFGRTGLAESRLTGLKGREPSRPASRTIAGSSRLPRSHGGPVG